MLDKINNTDREKSYTIGEMSKLLGIPASTLRYYDKEGLLPMLKRTDGGGRVFDAHACRTLGIIECLKRSGLSIKEIKVYIDLSKQGNSTLAQRHELFLRRREVLQQEMNDLQRTLAIIEYKCWYYETAQKLGSESDIQNIKLEDIPTEFRNAKKQLETIPFNGHSFNNK